jgi:hypothetical protein
MAATARNEIRNEIGNPRNGPPTLCSGLKIAEQEPREMLRGGGLPRITRERARGRPVALARRGPSGEAPGVRTHRLGPCYPASIAPPWATGGWNSARGPLVLKTAFPSVYPLDLPRSPRDNDNFSPCSGPFGPNSPKFSNKLPL